MNILLKKSVVAFSCQMPPTTRTPSPNDGDEQEQPAAITREMYPRFSTREEFATWTESLGFESMNENAKCGDHITDEEEEASPQSQSAGEADGVRSRSRSRTKRRTTSSSIDMSDFPPILSTLNKNGRPRFDVVHFRESGRLQMYMKPNELPEVVSARTPPGQKEKGGRLTIRFVTGDDQDSEDHEEDEGEREANDNDDIEEAEKGGARLQRGEDVGNGDL